MKLVLFFTHNVSLRTWDQVGMFDREVALYRRLQERGVEVAFVTYGGRGDLQLAGRIPGVRILCNRWRLPGRIYRHLLPMLHGPSLARADVYKTNQTHGAGVALHAARLWRKPLIARAGYLYSEFVSREQGELAGQAARRLERDVYTAARAVVVTTPQMKHVVEQSYGVEHGRVHVIPNFVLVDEFRPLSALKQPGLVSFVGRLHPQKNLAALLTAMQSLPLRLLVVGDGPLRADLERQANALGVQVQFLERVPHAELPALLNRSEVFVLPSHYEGHPKALLEAMACGLPVVGADAPGIREVIRHGVTGWLCGTDPQSIRAAIQRLTVDSGLSARLGRNAREFVLEHYALESVVQMETDVLDQVMSLCASR